MTDSIWIGVDLEEPLPGDPITPNAATNDIRRIVELDSGGNILPIFDLEDPSNGIFTQRDTWKFSPPVPQTRFVASSRPYAGQRPVASSHDNGSVGGTWVVRSKLGSADDAIAKWRNFALMCDTVSVGRYIEWRPKFATRSTLFEIRGPATWTPTYSTVQFGQTQSVTLEATWPVAPLAEGQPLDILDDFTRDNLDQYTADAGSISNVTSSGVVHVTVAGTEYRLIHFGRGYRYGDHQVTVCFNVGATVGSLAVGGILKRVATDSYLKVAVTDSGSASSLGIYVVTAGSQVLQAAVGLTRLATGNTRWVRGRIEGNTIYAEYFTALPGPMTTPTSSVSYTLSSGEQVLFGLTKVGRAGLILNPPTTDSEITDFYVEPYTYRNATLPARIHLNGDVPGDAPSRADLVVTPSGGTDPPAFAAGALFPHFSQTDGPYGLIEAETGVDLVGWTAGVLGLASNGNALKATPSGAGTASANFTIRPSRVASAPLDAGQMFIEVFARVYIGPNVVSPRLVAWLFNADGTAYGQNRYSDAPFGSAGVPVVLPITSTAYRLVRLGVVIASDVSTTNWKLHIGASWAAGSSGADSFSLDQLILLPAKGRVISPTGKVLDSSYPRFVQTTAETIRTIKSDLRGFTTKPGTTNTFPDTPLGGTPIEPSPGDTDLLLKLSSLVPDDPSATAVSEQLTHSATVHVAVTPRSRFGRI